MGTMQSGALSGMYAEWARSVAPVAAPRSGSASAQPHEWTRRRLECASPTRTDQFVNER